MSHVQREIIQTLHLIKSILCSRQWNWRWQISSHHWYIHILTHMLLTSANIAIRSRTRKRWTFAQNKKNTYSSVLHIHTVLMQLYPCGRYRQLNSVLYPNNLTVKSSKTIFNGFNLKRMLVLVGNLKAGKPRLCFCSPF